MPAILRLSPAATGKTTALVKRARVLARSLSTPVRVVVPGYPQVRAWRRSLAEQGGVLGVHVFTFPQLYQQILDAAGRVYTRLRIPVQIRLLQSIVDHTPLKHYVSLRDKPGFITGLRGEIAELKAGRIWPETFAGAVNAMGAEPRLIELAAIYTAYQKHLQDKNWADRAGMGWLSAEVLEDDPKLCHNWPVLYVDGFDDLSPVQIDVIKHLARRIPEMVLTLTGEGDMTPRLVHRRYARTRERLVAALDDLVIDDGLVPERDYRNPTLIYLESALLTEKTSQVQSGSAVEMVAAPNREDEIRAAMRWLKERVVYDQIAVGKIALLARNIEPYRHYIRQTAGEFGMPIHMLHDAPLSENPCVAAVLNLLSLPEDDFPWQRTVEVWFSPYFDWALALNLDAETYNRVNQSRQLNAVAVWGKVIGGCNQWLSAFEILSGFVAEDRRSYDDEYIPLNTPVGFTAQKLLEQFTLFANYLKPPEGKHPYSEFVYWLETMIGDYSEEGPASDGDHLPLAPSLGVIDNLDAGPSELKLRDQAALQAFKDVLRGFVWAEATVMRENIDYHTFLDDLKSAIDGANYHLPLPADREAVLVSDVIQVRGIGFTAVAVLGLAEGEFPKTSREDPFLTDSDRTALHDQYGLHLNLSTESHEVGYFYDAITRPSERLLLTRPRLTDSGAAWQPSPFWLEVQSLVDVKPQSILSDSIPDVYRLASQTESIFHCAVQSNSDLMSMIINTVPSRWSALEHASHLMKARMGSSHEERDVYEGNLTAFQPLFTELFGPRHTWSASRLESYRTCPFMFFTGSVLKLEPRDEPEEGYDARQLGNIYHHIFESVYKAVADPTDIKQLLDMLPGIAETILDEAPRKEQFRITAWWMQSRQEIIENVRNSLEALHQIDSHYVPCAYEQQFGLGNAPPLVVKDGEDSFRVRGYIDRVDQAQDGTIRIIDYKTSGPTEFTPAAVRQGKKLQLPLYALAARDALGLGDPTDGFYWHVRDAQASSFTLAKFGPEAAIHATVTTVWEIIRAARSGEFTPEPPRNGCPHYCPAAAICWQYQAGFG